MAFRRGDDVAVVVPRLVMAQRTGGAGAQVALPRGRWHNVLGGGTVDGGGVPVSDLWRTFPVAVLERVDAGVPRPA